MPTVKPVRPGNDVQFSGLETSDLTSTDDMSSADDFMRTEYSMSHNFMYLHCIVGHLRVTALLDSGSSINIISRSFYDTIPDLYKSDFHESDEKIVMADNPCEKCS